MSVPPSSSNNISDNNKLGGASPSPIEGIEGVPGPSSLDPMHSVLPQDEESEDYGDDEEEGDEESSEGESEVSQYQFCLYLVSFFFFFKYIKATLLP